MRRAVTFLSIALPVATLILASAAPRGTAHGQLSNYAQNPGFEIPWLQQDDGLLSLHGGILEPAHWWPRHAALIKQALYDWDSRISHSGTCSVSVDTRRQNQVAPPYEAWSSFVEAYELAGSTVTLRAMVMTDGLSESASVEFRIHAFRDGIAVGNPCGASSAIEPAARAWAEHSLTFDVPGEADRLIVQLGIRGTGKAWFDDVVLAVEAGAEPSDEAWSIALADPRLIYVMDSGRVVREEVAPPAAPLARKPWNILLYAAADFTMAFTPLEPFASHVQSNQHFNVLILEDYIGLEAAIWRVDRSGIGVHITPVLELGETATDESVTLERFLVFADRWFPAERTLLYLYGHGHAWWGACNDRSGDAAGNGPTTQDWLTPPEMRAALERAGGADAVLFSAPCLMSSLESAYELRDVANLYVASEELSGYNFWTEAVAPIAASLAADPDLDVSTLGRTIIDSIRDTVQARIDSGDESVPHQPTIAATRTSDLSGVGGALDVLALALIAALPTHRTAVVAARGASTTFAYGELVDLFSFTEACREIPGVEEAAVNVLRALDRAVIAQTGGMALDGDAHGLSLYFPVLELEEDMTDSLSWLAFDSTGKTYLNYGLSLVANTHWYRFLEAFFAPPSAP